MIKLTLQVSNTAVYNIFVLMVLLQHKQVISFQPFLDTEIDYAASHVDFKSLIKFETEFILMLHKDMAYYTGESFQCESLVHDYTASFESTVLYDIGLTFLQFSNLFYRSVINLDGFSEDITKHPFKTFKIIHRFINQLKNMVKSCRNIKEALQNRELVRFPRQADLDTAMLNILRLNQLYKLPVNEFANGKLHKIHTDSKLSSSNLREIGEFAMNESYYSQAVDFLAAAMETFQNETDMKFSEEMHRLLNIAIEEHDAAILKGFQDEYFHPESGPLFFDSLLINSDHDNFKTRSPVKIDSLLHDIPTGINETEQWKWKVKAIQEAYMFEQLCRGEGIKTASNLKCYVSSQSHASFLLKPHKMQVLHEDPWIIQYHDALTEKEMLSLKNEVKNEMRISRTLEIGTNQQGASSRRRTSSNAWIKDEDYPEFYEMLGKFGRILGVHTTGLYSAESLQVAAYSPGGHYVPHTDAIFEEPIIEHLEPSEFLRGDRIITFMVYLSDVEEGGETVFPLLKTSVKPKKGSAVAWYNLKPDGSIDRRMLHGGCSVIYGIKWIANKWIRSHDQMFIKKCPLNSSSSSLKFNI